LRKKIILVRVSPFEKRGLRGIYFKKIPPNLPFSKGGTFKLDSLGFTLIELLIVIAIISIVITGALLAVGDFGQSRKTQLEAQQFKNLLVYASHRAILTGQTLNVTVHEKGYDYYLLQGEHWVPLKEKIFESHTWSGAAIANMHSQIIINPQGDMTAFSFALSMHNTIQCRIRGDENGEITVI
jgi:type II secretion system protein H